MKLKDFIPPVMIKIIKRREIKERQEKEARDNREYETYANAFDACLYGAYESYELCQMIAAKTIAYRRQLEEKPYRVSATNSFLLSIIHQYLFAFKTDRLNIVDFGGACGTHYFEIRRLIPSQIILNWQVVETPSMVAAARAGGLSSNELQFIESLDLVNDPVDLLHSSGALQYVPDPWEYLTRLLGLKAKWLLFNRMMFSTGIKDIITIQRSNLSANGPGPLPVGYVDKEICYPHTTLSLPKFRDRCTLSYRPIWDFDEVSGSFALGDFNIVGKGLFLTQADSNGIQQDLPAALAAVP